MTSNYRYQHRAVRHLAWACFAPPLIEVTGLPDVNGTADCRFELTQARQAWLQALDRAPGELEAWLDARSGRRLGLYFERLWQFFLAQDDGVREGCSRSF